MVNHAISLIACAILQTFPTRNGIPETCKSQACFSTFYALMRLSILSPTTPTTPCTGVGGGQLGILRANIQVVLCATPLNRLKGVARKTSIRWSFQTRTCGQCLLPRGEGLLAARLTTLLVFDPYLAQNMANQEEKRFLVSTDQGWLAGLVKLLSTIQVCFADVLVTLTCYN